MAIIGATFGWSAPGRALTQTQFEVPPALKHQVDFWREAFTKYGRRQVVVHDTHRLDRVYSVLDFRHLDEQGLNEVQIELTIEKAVAREKKRIRGVLLRLHHLGPHANLTEEELRIGQLFRSDQSPQKFYFAASKERIRAQWGLRERFADGITVGHRYFPAMEAIFRQEGVPAELTRLPLVESSFNIQARSKVGAAGIWQFMPSTGRRFLHIDDAVDERLDPLAATRAAARYLRENYERLGTWPLALTAYNHGPNGIARAVRQLGTTNVVVLIEQYRGRSFGFASRNFYPEFLAALEAERNHRQYFGPLPLDEPRPTDEVELRHYLPLPAVTTCAGIGAAGIAELNPGVLPTVYEGKQRFPQRYRLRLPGGTGRQFERCYARLPAKQKFSKQQRLYVAHRVRRGQTLSQIARRYGSTVERIRRRNKLRNANLIRIGQVLEVPVG